MCNKKSKTAEELVYQLRECAANCNLFAEAADMIELLMDKVRKEEQ